MTCFVPECGGDHSAKDCPNSLQCPDCHRHNLTGTKCTWTRCPSVTGRTVSSSGKGNSKGGSGKSGGRSGNDRARAATSDLDEPSLYAALLAATRRLEKKNRDLKGPRGGGYDSSVDNSDDDCSC